MDFISSLISQISPVSSSSGSSGSLPQKFSSELSQNLTNYNFGQSSVTKLSDGQYLIKTPSLSNVLSGVSQITVSTNAPLESFNSFKVLPTSFTFSGDKANPVLELTGNIKQNVTSGQGNPVDNKPYNFSTSISLDSFKNASGQSSSAQQAVSPQSVTAQANVGDKVQIDRNNLIGARLNSVAKNLDPSISNLLKNTSGFENFKPEVTNNFQIKLANFTDPKGNNVILNSVSPQPVASAVAAGTNASRPVITGVLEFLPNSKEAVIRTEFGNFRTPSLEGVPVGSKISFFVENIAKPSSGVDISSLTNLSQVQSLLKSEGSPLSNLLQSLVQTPQGAEFASKLFPSVFDKFSYAKNLWFLSAAISGDDDAWMGKDAKSYLQNTRPDSDGLLNSLKDLFGAFRSAFRGDAAGVSDSWNQYLIPFYNGKNLDMVNFYTEAYKKDGREDRDSKGRKFIVEFEQEKYGQILIEGLYIRGDGEQLSELDFIVSAEEGFDEIEQADIKEIFFDLAEKMDFAGTVIFKDDVPDFRQILNAKTQHQDIVI